MKTYLIATVAVTLLAAGLMAPLLILMQSALMHLGGVAPMTLTASGCAP